MLTRFSFTDCESMPSFRMQWSEVADNSEISLENVNALLFLAIWWSTKKCPKCNRLVAFWISMCDTVILVNDRKTSRRKFLWAIILVQCMICITDAANWKWYINQMSKNIFSFSWFKCSTQYNSLLYCPPFELYELYEINVQLLIFGNIKSMCIFQPDDPSVNKAFIAWIYVIQNSGISRLSITILMIYRKEKKIQFKAYCKASRAKTRIFRNCAYTTEPIKTIIVKYTSFDVVVVVCVAMWSRFSASWKRCAVAAWTITILCLQLKQCRVICKLYSV